MEDRTQAAENPPPSPAEEAPVADAAEVEDPGQGAAPDGDAEPRAEGEPAEGEGPQAMRIGRGQGTWLAGRILDPERRLPVVAVTLPPRRDESWMDVPRLARGLVDKAELFVVETGAATWELAAALPSRLDVYGGAARIWWPGVSSDSDPYGHPLVFAWGPDDGEPATRRILKLVGADDGEGHRPATAHAPQTAVQQAIELMQARAAVTRLEHETKVLARELEQVREERSRLINDRRLLRDSEQRLRRRLRDLSDEEGDAEDFGLDPLNSEATFLSELHATFGRLYTGQGGSTPRPQLARLGAGFLDSLRAQDELRAVRALEACVHVLAGRAEQVPGLQAQPLPAGVEGAPQLVRTHDGARAWRCLLAGAGGTSLSLRWWVLPGVQGGALEFACVSAPEDLSIGETPAGH